MPEDTLKIGTDGWCSGIRIAPSTHFDGREGDRATDTVVLHNITLPPGEFGTGCVEDFFCSKLDIGRHPSLAELEGIRVSSHFFIRRDGEIVQFVSCLERAWHAGVSSFMGQSRCNDFTIGIEIEGTDFVPFEEVQYRKLAQLLAALHERYHFKYVVAHSDIAPGRKTDPGPYFDWARLQRDAEMFGNPEMPGAAARMYMAAQNPESCMV